MELREKIQKEIERFAGEPEAAALAVCVALVQEGEKAGGDRIEDRLEADPDVMEAVEAAAED